MDGWAKAILGQLADHGGSLPVAQLRVLIGQALERPVDSAAFDAALQHLRSRRLIALTDNRATRIEPDFKEQELESAVEEFLRGKEASQRLHVALELSVFQKTTVGGASGAGPWSRPDFTLAAIRQWRFDPLRHLDVFSFELKNRAGTSLVAVHEALAHARFSHYAYLVCPRSELNAENNDALAEECARYGVGLVQFDLNIGADGGPAVEAFRFELAAVRGSPDPAAVEQHLINRLSDAAQARLMLLASRP